MNNTGNEKHYEMEWNEGKSAVGITFMNEIEVKR